MEFVSLLPGGAIHPGNTLNDRPGGPKILIFGHDRIYYYGDLQNPMATIPSNLLFMNTVANVVA